MSYTYEYPHPAVATDCVVFGFNDKELEILLIQRGIEPFKGMWAFPGGFIRMDESAEQCALRELEEETGLKVQSIKHLGAFSSVNRDPRERVVSVAFYALVRPSEVKGGDDADSAKWFPIHDVPQLAFDHDFILRKAQQQLRKDIYFEPIGFDLLEESFTMSELQRLYESILEIRFDRRNFEKKMIQSGILSLADSDDDFYEQQPDRIFGNHSEMREMDIDNLFFSFDNRIPFDEYNKKSSKNLFSINFSIDVDKNKKQRGRKGRKWKFNKEQYDKRKNDNNFKLEF